MKKRGLSVILAVMMLLVSCGVNQTKPIGNVSNEDAAALKELQSLAEGRLTRKGEESITYSPEQYAVVEKAEVITAGNYLAVLVSPDVDALADIFNQAAN